ncbi:MAG: threonine aldolase [Epulopiscium sp. Nele67-Bin005]|nr:MAG: threonine aldolase [Epulopiscium sp. Nele67-Bin005]
MYRFKNDYSEGAHPLIMEELLMTNRYQTVGYGEDEYTQKACELIKAHIECEEAEVHLLVGGTQTNLTALGAFLRPHEAVIAVHSGHICVHETGAIEATGHKVISVDGVHGKLTPQKIQQALNEHGDYHMVKPRMAYISNTTEVGTTYSLAELVELSEICKANDLLLFMDGARLGSALTAFNNDMRMADIAKYTDAFYIGGTKNGALFGEALVITNPELQKDFKYLIKQRGALLAKGRLLGIQFKILFEDDLFYKLALHANQTAQTLQIGLKDMGYNMLVESNSNQIFVYMSDEVIDKLKQQFDFEVWTPAGDKPAVIRLVTSWATEPHEVEKFLVTAKELINMN